MQEICVDAVNYSSYLMNMRQQRYMDYNATGQVYPEVAEEMLRVLQQGGNPSSVHAVGRNAKKEVENARAAISGIVNCRARDIIFTGGGTEANNLALKGLLNQSSLIVAATEHDSIIAPSKTLKGIDVHMVPVDQNGLVDIAAYQSILQEHGEGALVSVMMANNETGVLQDIPNLTQMAHEHGALMHVDAIQAFAKLPLDFKELDVDLMTLSSHKTGGPQGVGGLIVKPNIPLQAEIVGGGQELGRRSGTENVAGISGFGKAAMMAGSSLAKMTELEAIRDFIEAEILKICPHAPLYGQGATRLKNTSNIGMPGVQGETQVMHFDLAGIMVSSGSACSSGKVKESHVLRAMGATQEEAREAVRVSLGWKNTREDAVAFIKAWAALYDRAGRKE